MTKFQTQQKVGILFVGLCWAVAVVNLMSFLTRPVPVPLLMYLTNAGVLFGMGALGLLIVFVNRPVVQIFLIFLFLLPAGPAIAFSDLSFIGLWMMIIAVTMIIKFQPHPRKQRWFLLAAIVYFLPWLVLLVLGQQPSDRLTLFRFLDYLFFLIVGVLTLYVLFEEEIRKLTRTNHENEAAISERDAKILKLEPLSELGQRVAHVTHSFKNNLSQLHAIATILETTHDVEAGVKLIREVSNSLDDRIENILLVSQAGQNPTMETFDVARVLEGMKFIYLSEHSFQTKVRSEMNLEGSLMITAVRWDFILMIENLVKNAYEAISTRSERGNLKITLLGGLLTIANDGGAMERCKECTGYCLNCPHYGFPGKTSKKHGSGLGLTQVFDTCRKYGWSLRIRTDEPWTSFQILLPDPRGQNS